MPKKKPRTKPSTAKLGELDLDPDAWPKFENLIKSAAKMGPKTHKAKAKAKSS